MVGEIKEEAAAKIRDGLAGVPAEVVRETPEAASAVLTWEADGESIEYRATASHVEVRDDAGRLIGKMFSIAFVALENGEPNPDRPVTFCYNGGPGCASVPLNVGAIGPKTVPTNGLGHIGPQAQAEDNPHTLLKYSDMVFLDALGTGWSVLAEDTDPKKVFGVDGDADAFARAIHSWLEREGRWTSPLYLFGESYGTPRNAVLSRVLGERGVQLTGVVMLSSIFDWAQILPGEDLYYLGMMPTFAAAAQHFGRAGVGQDPDEWFDSCMDFTEQVYAPALLQGSAVGEERGREVAAQLAERIGLPAGYVWRKRLRIDLDDFRAKLLEDEGRVVGRYDMRFTSDAPGPVQRSTSFFEGEDASDDAVEGAWTRAFRSLCHDKLGYQGPANYLSANYEAVGRSWDWVHENPGIGGKLPLPNVAFDLATAMRRNPTMRVAILGGRYDAATTFWNVRHDIRCQFLSPELERQVVFHRYGCGHMAYVDMPTLEQLDKDMAAFYGA